MFTALRLPFVTMTSMLTPLKRYYRPELDALRFCAFLSVFLFHGMEYYIPDAFSHMETYHLAWAGQWGVPMFFLLSAFLIVELLLRESDGTGTVHLKAFYIRRILRIWPLYFFAFYSFAFLDLFIPKVNPHIGTTWPYFTFFLGNWYISQHGWIAGPVDPLWSISVEEQFYLFIPIIIAIGGRRALRIASVIVLVVAYWAIYRYARLTWTVDNGEWTNSLVMFQFFAGGALLAMTLRGRVPQWKWATRLSAFAAGLTCWIVAQTVFGVRGWEPFTTVAQAFTGWPLVLIGCVLFLLSFLGITENRIPKWIAYLGRISFGLYVYHSLIYMLIFRYAAPHIWGIQQPNSPWHLPTVWALIACVLAISISIAYLSYNLLEKPFLRIKERFAIVPSRPE
jgi:peptidoglycan/LPS O-acetylase OafA/YrhL